MNRIDYWLERLEPQLEGTRKLLAEVQQENRNRELKAVGQPLMSRYRQDASPSTKVEIGD